MPPTTEGDTEAQRLNKKHLVTKDHPGSGKAKHQISYHITPGLAMVNDYMFFNPFFHKVSLLFQVSLLFFSPVEVQSSLLS